MDTIHFSIYEKIDANGRYKVGIGFYMLAVTPQNLTPSKTLPDVTYKDASITLPFIDGSIGVRLENIHLVPNMKFGGPNDAVVSTKGPIYNCTGRWV